MTRMCNVNYLIEIRRFNTFAARTRLPPSAQLLWYKLIEIQAQEKGDSITGKVHKIDEVTVTAERLGFNDGIIRRLCEFKEVGIKGKGINSPSNKSSISKETFSVGVSSGYW